MKNTYTVITTAPKTLIERYNHALRNPEGSLRITMPVPDRNKDKTIKNVLIEWEDGSDTFNRAELQELGAIQEKDGRERYVTKAELGYTQPTTGEVFHKSQIKRLIRKGELAEKDSIFLSDRGLLKDKTKEEENYRQSSGDLGNYPILENPCHRKENNLSDTPNEIIVLGDKFRTINC